MQTFSIYPQAVNVTPIVLSKAEADAIAYNKDPAKGFVFEPSKDDWWVPLCTTDPSLLSLTAVPVLVDSSWTSVGLNL